MISAPLNRQVKAGVVGDLLMKRLPRRRFSAHQPDHQLRIEQPEDMGLDGTLH